MGLPRTESPVPTPNPPTGTEKLENLVFSLFVGASGIRAGWRWLMFVVIWLVSAGILILVAVALGILHLKAGQAASSTITAPSVLIQEAIFVISLFGAALIMSKIERRPMGQYGLPLGEAFGRRFWEGVIWGLLAITVTMLIIAAFHGFTFGTLALPGRALVGYAILWAIAFLLTGFSEEFLFRGYSQFTLTTGMGYWPAAIFLSLIFGSGHLHNAGEAWPGALSAGLIGFFFCFTLWRTGSIWFAVGLHAAWDYGETFIFATPNSGLVAPGHLLNSSLHGPRWLTGGSVGPEGSVACFIVLALLFVVFHFTYSRQAAPTAKQ